MIGKAWNSYNLTEYGLEVFHHGFPASSPNKYGYSRNTWTGSVSQRPEKQRIDKLFSIVFYPLHLAHSRPLQIHYPQWRTFQDNRLSRVWKNRIDMQIIYLFKILRQWNPTKSPTWHTSATEQSWHIQLCNHLGQDFKISTRGYPEALRIKCEKP